MADDVNLSAVVTVVRELDRSAPASHGCVGQSFSVTQRTSVLSEVGLPAKVIAKP